MKCSHCGEELKEGVAFCKKCGTVVNPDATQTADMDYDYTVAPDYDNTMSSTYNGDYTQNYNQGQQSVGSKNNTTLIAVLCTCTVMLFLAIIAMFLVLQGGKTKSSKETGNQASVIKEETAQEEVPEEAQEEAQEEVPEEAPVVHPDPVFTWADCSSVRKTDSEAGQYSVHAVMDGDIQTKWAPVNTNRGVGEWVEIGATENQYVTGIEIANGYQRNESTWSRNNRVKDCTISFSDGTHIDIELLDQKNLQTVNFGREVETSSIRITINSIYHGTKWKDVAIAEIIPFNENN